MSSSKHLYFLSSVFCLFLTVKSTAQLDSIGLPENLTYQIESYIENIEAEVDFDFNTLYQTLHTYLQKPLNLNRADEYQLDNLGLLNDLQISSLLNYRGEKGDLLAIYELQAVPNFDLSTIYRILPFVTVNRSLDDLNESFGAILAKSKKNLYLRWSRNIEVPQGFQTKDEETPPAYRGDINKYYLRYAQVYENRISFGLTLEKDPGEEFFRNSNKQGFDFMSAHFMYKKVNKIVERLVIGDFRAKFGQGLILNTRFSPSKSAFVTATSRSGAPLNRFTSVNEQNYLRGAGATLKLNKQFTWTNFISFRKRDGNLLQSNALDEDLEVQNLNSLQLSGLHRTEREIDGENALKQLSLGTSLKYKGTKGNVAANVFYTQFNRAVGKSDQPYNNYFFKGKQLLNASLDYTYYYKNFIIFGETAWSDNNQFASVNGITATLSSKIAFSVHSRFMPRAFHSLFGQTFSETASVANENGWYIGLTFNPTSAWRFALYADTWRHPWLRFRADAPSRGSEYYARVTFYKRKDMEAYAHFKYESKQESYRLDYTNLDELLFKNKSNFRIHLNKKVTKRLSLRSRLEWSIFDIEQATNADGQIFYDGAFRPQSAVKSNGFMAYQDIIYKPVTIPLSVTTRFAIFNVDNYDARIYAYENDVTYQFSIPAYYNKGTRFYANLKYSTRQHLTLEARYAQTFWNNQTEFSSGNNRIEGQTKSEVKVQVRWAF